jgi:hypothetical protein
MGALPSRHAVDRARIAVAGWAAAVLLVARRRCTRPYPNSIASQRPLLVCTAVLSWPGAAIAKSGGAQLSTSNASPRPPCISMHHQAPRFADMVPSPQQQLRCSVASACWPSLPSQRCAGTDVAIGRSSLAPCQSCPVAGAAAISSGYPWSYSPVAELAPGRFAAVWEFACVPSLLLARSRLSQLDARPRPGWE